MNQSDPKSRFSSRVQNYVKYRPTYPPELLDLFKQEFNFTPAWTVADIGSGTGISSKLFLDHGNPVFAIEPNREMRLAAESLLNRYPSFHSISACAEATTMPDKSMDLIVAAQAFHWFNHQTTRAELARILKPTGIAALIWNTRLTDATPFLREYEDLLLKYATDYTTVRHEHVTDEVLASFFATKSFHRATLPNAQHFDFDGVKGRLLSSSYSPLEGDPRHAPMLEKLQEVFDRLQHDGHVTFAYKTEVFWSHLHAR